MKQWISIEKRLPEPYKSVLVIGNEWTRPAISFHHGECDTGGWSTASDVALQNGELLAQRPVTHWQPLPDLSESE